MGKSIKDLGRTISDTVQALVNLLTVQFTKVNGVMAILREQEFCSVHLES
jgi:hypothetical protein